MPRSRCSRRSPIKTLLDFWERRYPLAFDYRSKMMAEAEATGFIRGCDGGSMYMGKKPELPKCANYNILYRIIIQIIKDHNSRTKTISCIKNSRKVPRCITYLLMTLHCPISI